MGFLKKLKGVIVINDVDDTEGQTLSEVPKKAKIKKQQKGRDHSSSTASNEMSSDNMAHLTDDARIQKKKELDYKRKPNCMDNILFDEKLRIFYVVLLCLALGLAVPYGLSRFFSHKIPQDNRGYCGLNITYRMECLPGSGMMNEKVCNEANCCYDSVVMDDSYAPLCFHAIPADYSYEIFNSSDSGKMYVPKLRSSDRKTVLYSLGNQRDLTLTLTSKKNKTPFGEESLNLTVLIQRNGDDVVRIKIWDPQHDQVISDDFQENSPTDNYKLEVNVNDAKEDFNISVVRRDGKEIFNSVFGPLIYSENYMEITGRINTPYLYGFGQKGNFEFSPDFNQRKRWALFNFDSEASDDGTHSSHPFYMNVEEDGLVHGVYLRNTAPMEVGVYPIPAVVFRSLGGSIDLRFFAGPSPHDVSRQFVEMVGKPVMPPFWALGYHLCRTTSNLTEYEEISDSMEIQDLPYESDCVDARLNYLDSYANLSSSNWSKIQDLKESGRKFWLVQYPFVKNASDFYSRLLEVPILQVNGSKYYGMIANTTVGYPDYLDNNTIVDSMMNDAVIRQLYMEADGIMLFRNSPLNEVNITYTNTTDGGVCNDTHPVNCCPRYPLKFLPIGITDINNRTLCASVLHESLSEEEARLHLRTHNAYGQYHHQSMYELKKRISREKRPIVTSQSTFSGSGAFGGQFGGNYQPNFVAQQIGLVQVLQMGLYGIPLSGMPICGSTDDTNDVMRPEWCLRAHQVAAFLPFAMSHYEYGHTARNPPNFSDGFMNQIKYFIRMRYMMLPYMYTLFYEAHHTGTPVVRPLFYEFPLDEAGRKEMSQFLLGPGLLVSPVFSSVGNSDSINREAHFPPGCWYDFFKGSVISHSIEGANVVLPTLLTDINVHILGGKIIPLQGNLHTNISTTSESRQQNLTLVVALPCNLEKPVTTSTTTTEVPERKDPKVLAQGNLYMDDGETPMDKVGSAYHNLTFEATYNTLKITSSTSCDNQIGTDFTTIVDIVRLFGVGSITSITVNGAPHANFTQEPDNLAAYIYYLDLDWCKQTESVITWSY